MSDKSEEENIGERAHMYHTDGRINGHRKYSIIFWTVINEENTLWLGNGPSNNLTNLI